MNDVLALTAAAAFVSLFGVAVSVGRLVRRVRAEPHPVTADIEQPRELPTEASSRERATVFGRVPRQMADTFESARLLRKFHERERELAGRFSRLRERERNLREWEQLHSQELLRLEEDFHKTFLQRGTLESETPERYLAMEVLYRLSSFRHWDQLHSQEVLTLGAQFEETLRELLQQADELPQAIQRLEEERRE